MTAASICLTNRFHVALGLVSYRPQMTSNVVKTKRWHTSRTRVCHWCSYYILTSSVIITEQTRGNMESIRFMQCREKKKRHTYLVSLDCSRICAILVIFEVADATFRLFSLFPSLSYLHTVSQKRFSLPSLAQSRIMAKTFSELRVSRRDYARWQLLWRSVLPVQVLQSRQDLFLPPFFHLSSL